jgi:DNA polymerase-3 subunit beta
MGEILFLTGFLFAKNTHVSIFIQIIWKKYRGGFMRLIVDKKELSEVLRLVAGVLPPRSIHPILSNVLFTADKNGLRILGTDQDMTLEGEVEASIEEEGSIGIPAKRIIDLLRTLDDGQLSLSTNDSRLLITQGKGKFHIAGVRADDFPSVDILGEVTETFSIERKVLNRMINLTSFAVSRDIARINFSGLFFKISENLLSMVGTDGQRLMLIRRITETTNNPCEMLIPARTLEQIKKIFAASSEDEAILKYDTRALELDCGKFSLQSKLITERFPDYEQVIPRDNDKIVTTVKGPLESALARVSVLANPASNLVKCQVEDDILTISGKDYELGTEGKASVDINYEGESFMVGFSSKNFGEVLQHIDSDEVEMSFKTPQSAVSLVPSPQVEGETYQAILMPLRLTGDE